MRVVASDSATNVVELLLKMVRVAVGMVLAVVVASTVVGSGAGAPRHPLTNPFMSAPFLQCCSGDPAKNQHQCVPSHSGLNVKMAQSFVALHSASHWLTLDMSVLSSNCPVHRVWLCTPKGSKDWFEGGSCWLHVAILMPQPSV